MRMEIGRPGPSIGSGVNGGTYLIPVALCCDRSGPGSGCDGSDPFGHVGEGVPSVAQAPTMVS